jgi:hypothetical protein
MDGLPPTPTAPVFASFKARAIAGLTDEERQELLASAGMLGLAHDDDPFWALQATVTQLKTLMAHTRADTAAAMGLAEEAVEEARKVARALKPTSEAASGYIEQTVKGVKDELITKAASEIGRQMRIAYNAHLEKPLHQQPRGGKIVLVVLGAVIGAIVDKSGLLPALFGLISG